jgi:hypothetical protein
MGKTKKSIDWTAIERDYTKTSLPIRELARWYNCDEKAIRLRAKAGGWLRPRQENSAAPPPAPQPLDALVAPIVERLREMAPDEPAQTPDIVVLDGYHSLPPGERAAIRDLLGLRRAAGRRASC